MGLVVPFMVKLDSAVFAGEQLLPRMDTPVSYQVVAVVESLAAYLAGVGALSKVGALVAGQMGLPNEAAVTIRTGEGSVHRCAGLLSGEEVTAIQLRPRRGGIN